MFPQLSRNPFQNVSNYTILHIVLTNEAFSPEPLKTDNDVTLMHSLSDLAGEGTSSNNPA